MHPFLHEMSSPPCDRNLSLQISPVGNLRERAMGGIFFRQALFLERLIRLFQVGCQLLVDFVLLTGFQRKAGEAPANEFLPIRHEPPS